MPAWTLGAASRRESIDVFTHAERRMRCHEDDAHSRARTETAPPAVNAARRVYCRVFFRAPLLIATKPVLMGVTERRAPQLLHCMK